MNAKVSTDTKVVTRQADAAPRRVEADICVVGAGIAGVSAALTRPALGRKVVLVDGLPALGGQAVNSIIGTFCGLFANGTHGHQFTHGIADDILRDLGATASALLPARAGDDGRLLRRGRARPLDRGSDPRSRHHGHARRRAARRRASTAAGSKRSNSRRATATCDVERDRIRRCERRRGAGLAGRIRLPRAGGRPGLRHPDGGAREHRRGASSRRREEMAARMKEKGDDYGLVRREGLAFVIPGRGVAAHEHDACRDAARSAGGLGAHARRQGRRPIAPLRSCEREFPGCFGKCAGARLRLSRHPPDALDRRAPAADGRRSARRHAISRRDRAHRLADRTARSRRRARLADLSRRPRALHAARQPHSRRKPTTSSPPGAASTPTSRRCRACG